ncbi:Uncharacterised protein [Mycobacteroides abscessus subsp. abscessus]|nr:Uncharacterised protein [Mycobacteroides abscessus subsp. abscessus]
MRSPWLFEARSGRVGTVGRIVGRPMPRMTATAPATSAVSPPRHFAAGKYGLRMRRRKAASTAAMCHQRTSAGAKKTGIIHSTSRSTPETLGARRSETRPSMRIVMSVKAIVSIAVKPGVLAAGGVEA